MQVLAENPKFTPGQSVWRFYPPLARKVFRKGWRGPYLVVNKVSPHVYEIQRRRTEKPIKIHVDQLKLYRGRTPLKNWVQPRFKTVACQTNGSEEKKEELPVQPVGTDGDADETMPYGLEDIPEEDEDELDDVPGTHHDNNNLRIEVDVHRPMNDTIDVINDIADDVGVKDENKHI